MDFNGINLTDLELIELGKLRNNLIENIELAEFTLDKFTDVSGILVIYIKILFKFYFLTIIIFIFIQPTLHKCENSCLEEFNPYNFRNEKNNDEKISSYLL